MAEVSGFGGFHREVMGFFRDLEENNNRERFAEHKDFYTEFVVRPAQEFVVAIAERLLPLAPNVVADTRMNGHRCIAFSPYLVDHPKAPSTSLSPPLEHPG